MIRFRPFLSLGIPAGLLVAAGLIAGPARADTPAAPPSSPGGGQAAAGTAGSASTPGASSTKAAAAPASTVPGPAGGASPAGAQAAPVPPQDPRDQEIDLLRKQILEIQKRLEELEKSKATPPAPAPVAPAPEPEPAPAPAGPQGAGTLTPNISAIGNLIFAAGDTRAVPKSLETPTDSRGRFNFDEFELGFQDAVAPQMRYDVFMAADKGPNHWTPYMEEGYLTATGIAPGLSARVGDVRMPFGKFNPLHNHVWPFITQPAAITAFLGPDGLIGDGAELEYIIPVKDFFAQIQAGSWETESSAAVHQGFTGGDEGAYSGRLWLSKDLSRTQELELGFSRYQGNGDIFDTDMDRRRLALNGLDVTYRRYPGQGQRFLASAELIDHETDTLGPIVHREGGFAYATYRMNEFWEYGVRGDYSKFPYPVPGFVESASVFMTRFITEQTSLRLEYQYQVSPLLGTGNGIYFQILFGSGPHTHPLQ